MFFTTRLQVCLHTRRDIWLERSQVARHRDIAEVARTVSRVFAGAASSGKAVKAPPGHCPEAGTRRLQAAGLRTGRAAASTLLATCRPSYLVSGGLGPKARHPRAGRRRSLIGTNPRDARTCAPKGKFEDGPRPAFESRRVDLGSCRANCWRRCARHGERLGETRITALAWSQGIPGLPRKRCADTQR